MRIEKEGYIITDEPTQKDFDCLEANPRVLILVMTDKILEKFKLLPPCPYDPNHPLKLERDKAYKYIAENIYSKLFDINMTASSNVAVHRIPDVVQAEWVEMITARLNAQRAPVWFAPAGLNRGVIGS